MQRATAHPRLRLGMGLTGCRRSVYVLGRGHSNPKPTAARILTPRRCFRLPLEQHANQKYSLQWSPKFLESNIFWQSALYTTVFFGGVVSYFYYVSAW